MPYTDYSWIDDRLAVGGMVADSDSLPFDTVISLETWAPLALRDLVLSGGTEYHWSSICDDYCWEDHETIVGRFDGAAALINRSLRDGDRVLVHCASGVSRSVTAIVWYLMRYRDYTWQSAIDLVRAKRPQSYPNVRFEIALRLAGGESFPAGAMGARLAEACRELAQRGIEETPEAIQRDLVRQGTV